MAGVAAGLVQYLAAIFPHQKLEFGQLKNGHRTDLDPSADGRFRSAAKSASDTRRPHRRAADRPIGIGHTTTGSVSGRSAARVSSSSCPRVRCFAGLLSANATVQVPKQKARLEIPVLPRGFAFCQCHCPSPQTKGQTGNPSAPPHLCHAPLVSHCHRGNCKGM